MLPEGIEDRHACFLRWTNGDAQAAAFLMEMAEIVRLVDDLVDEDENRQRNAVWLWTRTLIHLPANEFFRKHGVFLGPLFASIIVQWQQSDEWRTGRDALKRTFGFVMREACGQIVVAVATIVGGIEFAKTVADDYFETCHAGSRETIQDWVKGD